MLRTVIFVCMLTPLAVQAACPRNIAGSYVAYGTKSGSTQISARAGLLTLGTLSSGVGSISTSGFVYNDITDDRVVSGESEPPMPNVVRYTYDGRCQGYVWQTDENDPSKLQVDFFFVSDSGAQIVLVEGPTGVAKNAAGNPVTPLPASWQNSSGQTGLIILRKQ
jgi:hypothetical protein